MINSQCTSSKKIHDVGGFIKAFPRPIHPISSTQVIVSPTWQTSDGLGKSCLINSVTDTASELLTESSTIYSASSVDEKKFVTGSKNGYVTLWSEGEKALSGKFFEKAVLVEYTNGKIFAIAEDSALVLLGLNLETKAVIENCLPGKINSLQATDKYVSYGGFNNLVTILDLDGQLALEYYQTGVASISVNDCLVASGGHDKSCQVWSITRKQRLFELKHSNPVIQVKFCQLGSRNLLITSCLDKYCRVWDSNTGEKVKSLRHTKTCARFDMKLSLLAVATLDGVTLWSTDTWKKVFGKKIGETADLRFIDNSSKLIAAKRNGEIHMFNLC